MEAPCTSPEMRRRQKADRSCMLPPPLARPVSCQATTADNNWPAVKSYLAFLCISSSYLSENCDVFLCLQCTHTHRRKITSRQHDPRPTAYLVLD
jgi:hypothetical protein